MNVLVLGAGQLARMMSLAGAPLNIKVSAYDVRSGDILHPLTLQPLGHGLDTAIAGADVITAEFEHIPLDVLKTCEASGKLKPSANAIQTGGDRRIEKALLDKAGVANAPYQVIENEADFKRAINEIGLPLVFKSALDGYDGKGQWRLKNDENATIVWQEISSFLADPEQREGQSVIAEAFIPFDREVSLIGARNSRGEMSVYSLTQNHHVDGILSVSIAANENAALNKQAEDMFKAVAVELDYIGVLAIEFFDVDGQLLVNEIAPRVHNSGHWTQQGAACCQFENHLRAVTGLPLGDTGQILPTAMVNILGQSSVPLSVYRDAHVHWYDKEARPGRKVGHINLTGSCTSDLATRLVALSKELPEDAYPELTIIATDFASGV